MSEFFRDFDIIETFIEEPEDPRKKGFAKDNPRVDYFQQTRPQQPKKVVGEYVAEQGFSVPLLDGKDDVSRAIDEGTLMIRSELAQDYDGLGGLYSSYVVDRALSAGTSENQKRMNSVLKDALRSGELPLHEYMERFHPYNTWQEQKTRLYEEALELGLDEMPVSLNVSASAWRYIEGTNIIMFRDPHVDGRYHFGVTPYQQPIGDYRVDEDEHTEELTFRKHRQPFIAEPFIEIYEEIRKLPLFDVEQVPVMELQQGLDGAVHFLQYRHVGKDLQLIEPFDLPEEGLRTSSVRGVTSPSGRMIKLEINPSKINLKTPLPHIYGDMFYFRNYAPLRTQLAAKIAGVVLCEDWLSFKDNHTPSAPLVLPQLAIGLYGADEKSFPILEKLNNLPVEVSSLRGGGNDEHFEVHVTSNGREAVLQSDWSIRQGSSSYR